MLAETIEKSGQDPKGWLMSEKLDGVRCFWNGTTMYTRNGKLFYPPKWFKDELPKNLALDGELWTKRDDFQKTVSIVRKQDGNDGWRNITYMVYDAPLLNDKFSKRLETIKTILASKQSQYVKLHKHEVCRDQSHLDDELKRVLALQGEGLMLKDPESVYERKRSMKLLKVKVFQDAEATVIGHQKGTGRCSSMLGALECIQTETGIKFKIGSGFTDAERRKPPKIGSRVTYKYQGLTKDGVPRFPIFLRIHPGM